MGFLSTAVSTFITNYLFTWIISLLPFKKKNLINVIVISIFNLGEILFYLITMIISIVALNGATSSVIFSITLSYLSEILAILLAYIAIMMILLKDVKLFKSRRLREFERNYNGKKGTHGALYIISILSIVLGSVSLIFGVLYIKVISSTLDIVETVFLILFGLLFIGVGIYLFVPKKIDKINNKNEDVLIDIVYLDNNFRFMGHVNSHEDLCDKLGAISKVYGLTDLGYIIKDKKIHVYQINTEHFELSYLDEVKLSYIKGFEYDKAIASFNKLQRKNIYLDENYEVIKENRLK